VEFVGLRVSRMLFEVAPKREEKDKQESVYSGLKCQRPNKLQPIIRPMSWREKGKVVAGGSGVIPKRHD